MIVSQPIRQRLRTASQLASLGAHDWDALVTSITAGGHIEILVASQSIAEPAMAGGESAVVCLGIFRPHARRLCIAKTALSL